MSDREKTISGPSVPEGWKLVPAQPTVAMHNAAATAGLCGKPPAFNEDGRLEWSLADASAVYLAMVAAAPTPPAASSPAPQPPLLGYLVTEEGGQFVDFIMPEDREGIAAYLNAAGVSMTEVAERSVFIITTGLTNACGINGSNGK